MENKQSLLLPSGRDVTLNIGLGKGSKHTIQGVPHRLRTITKLLPQVMEPGYIAVLHLTPSRVWVGEPMLVVQGTMREDAALSTLMWEGLEQAEQDCIAIWNHESEHGFLFGPKADAWGLFNVNFFYFIGDKHE